MAPPSTPAPHTGQTPGAAYLKELLNIRLVGALAIQEKEAGERLSFMRTPMVEALRRTIIMEIY